MNPVEENSARVIPPSRKKAAAANYLFGLGNTALLIINGIILVPIYLRHMSLGVYGAWLASGNFIAMLTVFDSGMGVVLTHQLASALGRNDRVGYARIASSGIIWVTIIGVSIAIGGITLSNSVASWLRLSGHEGALLTRAVALAAAAGGIGVINQTLNALPQANQITFGAGINSLISVVIGTAGTVLGLVTGCGVISLGIGLLAKAVSQLIGCMIIISCQWKRMRFPAPRITLGETSSLLKHTAPMFAAKLGNIVGQNSEAALAAILISPVAAAILSISSRVATVVRAAAYQFGSAVFAGISWIYSSGDVKKAQETIKKISLIFFIILCSGLGIVAAFNGKIISLWVGSDKYGGDALTFLIIAGVFVGGTTDLITYMLQAFGFFGLTSFAELLEVAVRLGLIILITKRLGLYGIVAGGLLASLVIKAAFLPKRLAKSLAMRPGQVYSSLFRGMKILTIFISIAVTWRVVIGTGGAWPSIALRGISLLVIMGCAILLDTPIRREILVLFRCRRHAIILDNE